MRAVLRGTSVQRGASFWSKNLRLMPVIAAAILLAAQSQQAQAIDTDPTPVTNHFEQGLLMRSGETVGALGPNLMGDSINDYSGALEFSQTDASLPGNNALPVAVGRRLVTGSKQICPRLQARSAIGILRFRACTLSRCRTESGTATGRSRSI